MEDTQTDQRSKLCKPRQWVLEIPVMRGVSAHLFDKDRPSDFQPALSCQIAQASAIEVLSHA